MAKFQKLSIVKIKGHAGHPENERADQLAVEAVQSKNKEMET
jgi:ribonuclease HI